MSNGRKVSTDALETLGTIIDDTQKRDAINIAVLPIVAAERLLPAQHIGLVEGGAGDSEKPLGGVDMAGAVAGAVWPELMTELCNLASTRRRPKHGHPTERKSEMRHPYITYAEARSPEHTEPVDTEIIPLCDALNAAGFRTNCSCWGHGRLNNEPSVCMFCTIEQAEALDIHLREASEKDLTAEGLGVWQACLMMHLAPWGHEWEIQVRAHDLYCDSTPDDVYEKRLHAVKQATAAVLSYAHEPVASERTIVTGEKP